MRRRRVLIVHNPGAGRRVHKTLVSEVASGLNKSANVVAIAQTRRRGHARELAAQAVADGMDMVVAAGGDGTINEVIQELTGTGVALGVIPVGTVNIWAAEVGIPGHAAGLINVLTEGVIRSVDVGIVGEHRFLLMASLGLDASVVQAVPLRLKRMIGRWAYAASLAALMPGYRGTAIQLSLDGKVTQCMALMVVIGNTRRYAGRLSVTTHAIIDDGMLDVTVLRGRNVLEGLAHAGAIIGGIPALRHSFLYGRARVVKLQSESPLPMQLDGDFGGLAPSEFRALPKALRVVVGPGQSSLFGAPTGPETLDRALQHVGRPL